MSQIGGGETVFPFSTSRTLRFGALKAKALSKKKRYIESSSISKSRWVSRIKAAPLVVPLQGLFQTMPYYLRREIASFWG